jgi:hypothetical protein
LCGRIQLALFRDFRMDGIRVDSTSNIRGVNNDIPGGWQLLQVICAWLA